MQDETELKRILYLEDDHDIRLIAHLALSTLGGFEVLACESGAQALEAGPAFAPQLMLFDVMLPHMDGLETLRRMRDIQQMQSVPVVFMTAKVQDKEIAEYRRLGAIGVISKPFNSNTLADQLRGFWNARTSSAPAAEPDILGLAHTLREMAAAFGSQLPKRIMALEQLCLDHPGPEQMRLAIREAHALAGSGGTFGYANLSRYMHSLQELLQEYDQRNDFANPSFKSSFSRLISEVRSNALAPQRTIAEILGKSAVRAKPDLAATAGASKQVYVCDDDEDLGNNLAAHISSAGLKVQYFNSLDSLIQALQEESPDAIVLDIDFPEGRLAGVERLIVQDIPLIFISSHTDIWARLGAVRAGGQAYFIKPFECGDVVDRLSAMLDLQDTPAYKVMIIDDMADTAGITGNILTQAGMAVKTVTDPLLALQAIRDFTPELILMDMYMPEVSGQELAIVIRQDPTLTSIPIIFLSAEQNLHKQLTAMSFGADDFLLKSLDAQFLVRTVASKIDRYRELRRLMSTDGLTGLLNHTKTLERLNYELARAKRRHSAVSFVMIDLDNFKAVNDSHGHLVGDQILKRLAQVLKRRLRCTDIIGRYGGEEFAVILPDTKVEDALRVMEQLRIQFGDITHSAATTFAVTFSAGVAQAVNGENSAQYLIAAADRALYAAKRKGRNCVVADD